MVAVAGRTVSVDVAVDRTQEQVRPRGYHRLGTACLFETQRAGMMSHGGVRM